MVADGAVTIRLVRFGHAANPRSRRGTPRVRGSAHYHWRVAGSKLAVAARLRPIAPAEIRCTALAAPCYGRAATRRDTELCRTLGSRRRAGPYRRVRRSHATPPRRAPTRQRHATSDPHPLRSVRAPLLPSGDPHSLPAALFRYIIQFSLPQQAVLVLLTLASLPVYYASLDLPKQIVDRAIGGNPADFPKSVGFAGIDFGQFDQLQYLAFLAGLFLLTVLINGGFKYVLNVYKGRLGEAMLRRLRAQLLSRILRFPLPQFRRLSQGELIAMVTGEVEALGGYFGDAMVTPLFQAGLLLTALGFIFAQDLVMGLAAVALYPLQAYFIPKLQRQVNLLGFARVREVRSLSQRIGEVTSVIEDVHANYADQAQLTTFGRHLDRIFRIRYDIYRKKFFIKFLNNFIAQLTPFFFLSIGGYLVLRGSLTLGSLVGVLAAYKDLAPPWKELLDFYQIQQDAKIKYAQLRAQFDPPGLRPPLDAEAPGDEDFVLDGAVEAEELALEDDGDVLLDQVSLHVPPGSTSRS